MSTFRHSSEYAISRVPSQAERAARARTRSALSARILRSMSAQHRIPSYKAVRRAIQPQLPPARLPVFRSVVIHPPQPFAADQAKANAAADLEGKSPKGKGKGKGKETATAGENGTASAKVRFGSSPLSPLSSSALASCCGVAVQTLSAASFWFLIR